jgi:O-methyltransferase involved in polyketide biosynthesis
MSRLALGRRFDGIVAWDSLFHLPPEAQRTCFATIAAHAGPGCALLFNSGTEAGESVSRNFGAPLYHASLSAAAYGALLEEHGFAPLRHIVHDPDCGDRAIWLAQRRADG